MYEPYGRSMPWLCANCWARSREREPHATTCWRVCRSTAATVFAAMRPGAITPHRSVGASAGSGMRLVGIVVMAAVKHATGWSGLPHGAPVQ